MQLHSLAPTPAWPSRCRLGIATLILSAGLCAQACAQPRTTPPFDVLPQSRVQLYGSATLHRWQCSSKDLTVRAALPFTQAELFDFFRRMESEAPDSVLPLPTRNTSATGLGARVELTLEAASLDCGNPRMERDMHRALDARNHPTIRYTYAKLRRVQRVPTDGPGPAPVRLDMDGTLELAGVVRPVSMELLVTPTAPCTVRVSGTRRIQMSDFGIEPPTALLGLIRAHDPVDIVFDVHLRFAP